MARGLVLLGDKTFPGKGVTCIVTLNIRLSRASKQQLPLFPGFEDSLKTIAEDAFANAIYEVRGIDCLKKELSVCGITGRFRKSRNINTEEGESAGLLFALLTVVEIYQNITGKQLGFAFAATGDISDKDHTQFGQGARKSDEVRVRGVSFINQKLEAAINRLGRGDKVFYPAHGNDQDVAEHVIKDARRRNIELVRVSTLKEAIETLLGIKARPPTRKSSKGKIAAVGGLLLFLSTLIYGFWPKHNKSAFVAFKSNPPGAVLLIDGVNKQEKTPVTEFEVEPGPHFFSLAKPGYQNWQKVDTLQANEKYTYSAELRPLTGNVEIRSLPSEANVTIDQKQQEITPYRNDGLLAGLHTVRVTKPGYHTWKRDLNFAPHKDTLLTITLTPTPPPATLVLASKPPGARIYLDGRQVSDTKAESIAVKVNEGTHQIVFEHPEFGLYGRAEFPVSVTAGTRKNIICHYESFINVTSFTESDHRDQSLPIVINGEITSYETPVRIPVPPGIYHVTIRSSRFRTVGAVPPVEVKPTLTGEPYKVVLKLRKIY